MLHEMEKVKSYQLGLVSWGLITHYDTKGDCNWMFVDHNTFHSSTDSGRIPRIPAGIQEFRGIPGIPEDSGRNQQESKWNRHKFSSYFALLFQLFQKCFGRG